MIEDRFMRPDPAPWLQDEHAEPRLERPLASDRGPIERDRKILTVNMGRWAQRISRWLGR